MAAEADWEAISKANIESPDWHEDVLAKRELLTLSGEEQFIAWEAAKKQLRDELT